MGWRRKAVASIDIVLRETKLVLRISQNMENFPDPDQCTFMTKSSASHTLVVDEKDQVGGLLKGLRLIEAFDETTPRMTSSQAAARTGMTPAAARRGLLTLCHGGYAGTDGKFFWLEHGVLGLTYAYSTSTRLPTLLQPTLDSLSERTRESASVAVLHGLEVLVAARSTARKSLTVGLGVGSRLPLHCSATGRVLLSTRLGKDFEDLFKRMPRNSYTRHTVTEPLRLRRLIQQCAERGYAMSNEELEIGVRSIAVPLYNIAGTAVGALSLSSRADRMTASEMEEQLLPAMRRSQAWVQRRLG